MNTNNEVDVKISDSKIIDYGRSLENIDDDIIKLFNLFLISNPNYLYNKTYILDSLSKFKESIKVLKNNSDKTKKLARKLSALSTKNGEWFAIVDNYYIITSIYKDKYFSYYELHNLINKEKNKRKDSLKYIKRVVNKYINCNNLNRLSNNTSIRIFYNEFNRLFSEYENQKILFKVENFIKECDGTLEGGNNGK